jgi:Peptidoglycan-binding protein, CsiV
MKLRDFALAACLFACQPWSTALAQQTSSAPPPPPAEPHPAEPHPLPAAAPAGAVVYTVEVIVFRTTATLGSPENWSAEAAQAPAIPLAADGEAGTPGADPPPAAMGPAAAPTGSRFIRALAPAEFQLADLESRIRSSASYAPVAHVGWLQTASPWGSHESMTLQQLGFDAPLLAGTVQLERGQFLHLGFALNLTVAAPPAGLNAPPQTTFVLTDNHRVKLYERNYYDAPAFGVIALVAPAQGGRRAGR